MSEYDIISNFRTEFSPLILSKMRYFCNFFISQPIKLKFGTGIQNWMLILIVGHKVVLVMILDNMTQNDCFSEHHHAHICWAEISLTETKIKILCDHVDHTRFHIVEMGRQMVQLLSAHIVGPTMFVNLTPAIAYMFV